ERRRTLDANKVYWLFVAGDEIMTSALDESFHQTVKDRILETIRLDSAASESELIATTLPLADAGERDRELAMVRRLSDAVGADNLGTWDAGRVITALQAGQVATLVIV